MPVLAEAKKTEGRGTPLPDFVMVGDARLERAAFGSGDQRVTIYTILHDFILSFKYPQIINTLDRAHLS